MSARDSLLRTFPRSIKVAACLLLGAVGCAPTVPAFDPRAVTLAPQGPDSATAANWAAKADSQIGGTAYTVLDQAMYCFLSSCQWFVRRVQPAYERNYRDQVTKSVSRELSSAVLSSRMRQYLVPSREYAAFRTLALLVDPRPEALQVEAQRLQLDRQRAVIDSAFSLSRALEGPSLIAAVLLERLGRLESTGPMRSLLDSVSAASPSLDLRALRDPNRDLVVVLGSFLPGLVSLKADVQVPMEGVVRTIRVAVPAFPGHVDSLRACALSVGGERLPLFLAGDLDGIAHVELAAASVGAAQRSLLRNVGRQAASDEASKRMTAGSSLGTAILTRSLMSGLLARTEQADTRGAHLVPAQLFLVSVPRGAVLGAVDCVAGDSTVRVNPVELRLRTNDGPRVTYWPQSELPPRSTR